MNQYIFNILHSDDPNDNDWAEWIYFSLENSELYKRSDLGSHITATYDGSDIDFTLLIISEAFLLEFSLHPEWTEVFQKDPTGMKRKLILVKVEDVELKGILTAMVTIDLFGKSEQKALKDLLLAVSGNRKKPTQPPSFPSEPMTFEELEAAYLTDTAILYYSDGNSLLEQGWYEAIIHKMSSNDEEQIRIELLISDGEVGAVLYFPQDRNKMKNSI